MVIIPLLLALHTANNTNLEAMGGRLWRAVFKYDYSSVYVLNCNNEIVVDEFPLVD
jgi:hypothetical protein